jgi:putative hydrolase of the HAD superfamily
MTSTAEAPVIVWTDFGGVITPPIAHTLAQFCSRIGVETSVFQSAMRRVAGRYGTTDVMAPLDTPLITESRWAEQVAEVLRTEHGARVDLSDFADKWFADRETNHVWLSHLWRLRDRGYTVGVLSNMVPAWDRHWRAMVPDEGLFSHVVLSFEVGKRKPQRDIFELAAARAGAPPQHCVLVDDLLTNCSGARDAGWAAVRFSDTRDSISCLEEVLSALPAPAGRPSNGGVRPT